MNVPECYVMHTFSCLLTQCYSDKYDDLYEYMCIYRDCIGMFSTNVVKMGT